MRTLKFRVPRIGEPDDQREAIVEAVVHNEEVQSSNDLLNALTEAMTRWVRETDEGKDFWESTSHDANVGDLLNHYDGGVPEAVAGFLVDKGIIGFKVSTLTDLPTASSWTYDTVLVNEGDLEPE